MQRYLRTDLKAKYYMAHFDGGFREKDESREHHGSAGFVIRASKNITEFHDVVKCYLYLPDATDSMEAESIAMAMCLSATVCLMVFGNYEICPHKIPPQQDPLLTKIKSTLIDTYETVIHKISFEGFSEG